MPTSMTINAMSLLMAAQVQPSTSRPPFAPPLASEPSSPTPPTEPDIVVTGRTAQSLDKFIEQVTQARQGHQIARWDRRVCIRTLGLDSAHNAFVVDGIAKVAKTLNIAVALGQCRGDIVIVFTRDADKFAALIIKRYPKLFQDTSSGVSFLNEQREDLLRSRPVRWVNASRTGPAVGGNFIDGTNRIYTASRIMTSTREYSVLSMAIVDPNRLNGLSWSQLVDYLVMVSLANQSMKARFERNTILSMFRLRDEGSLPPSKLTTDDKALLHAMYDASVAPTADNQRRAIRVAIARPNVRH